MTPRFYKTWALLLALLAITGGLASCGSSGGSSAAPTGGGSTPVSVEIPSLDSVTDIPFTTGIVVAGSSSESVPLDKSVWKSTTKTVGTSGNPFTTPGMSEVFCEKVNSWRTLLDASTLSDQNLCILQDNITTATTAGINLLDGNYHIYSSDAKISGIPAKYKTKVTVDSNKIVTAYEMFACDSTTQLSYTSYTITGKEMEANVKTIRSAAPQKSTVKVTGTLSTSNSLQYTKKVVDYLYSGSMDSGALFGIGKLTQTTSTAHTDAFDSRGDGSNVGRIYAQADLTQPSAAIFTPKDYALGSGAGTLIESGGLGPTTTTTECWDGTSLLPVTCLDSNSNYTAIKDKTPMAVSAVTIAAFSGSDAWDCSGTAEFTITFSSATNSCFDRFNLNVSHIDCDGSTQSALTVTPTVSSTTLSTSEGSPTSVTTTPSIVLTASQGLDTTSVNSTTVKILDTSIQNEVDAQVSFDRNNYQTGSNNTILTLSPTLTSGKTYKLILVGSSTTATSGTVIRAPGADAPKDQLQSTGTYYMSVP